MAQKTYLEHVSETGSKPIKFLGNGKFSYYKELILIRHNKSTLSWTLFQVNYKNFFFPCPQSYNPENVYRIGSRSRPLILLEIMKFRLASWIRSDVKKMVLMRERYFSTWYQSYKHLQVGIKDYKTYQPPCKSICFLPIRLISVLYVSHKSSTWYTEL